MIVSLTFHLFNVYSKLLYYLNPEVVTKHPFSFLYLDEPTILGMLFALSYSLATISILFTTNRKSLVVIFAILDAIGVLLYYFTKIPISYGAFYFALYTCVLILSIAYLDNQNSLPDKINDLKDRGLTQREIAAKLKISESKVSRILKRTKKSSKGKEKPKSKWDIIRPDFPCLI